MNLLPKTHQEFGSADYWNKFFKQRGSKAFEWYGEYGELCGIVHKYIKKPDKILVIGCGNSKLSADIYDVGYNNIVNIDISDVVIRQMTQAHKKERPQMQFVKMDMLNMDIEDGAYSVVLDKGTLDALMTDDTPEVAEKALGLFKEISRVLKLGGRYICVSLAQEHIIKAALSFFQELGWPCRVCRLVQDDDDDEKEFHMPVFVYIFTKFKKMPNMKSILEIAEFEDKINRVSDINEVLGAVKGMQYYGIVRQRLNSKEKLDEQLNLELYGPESSEPKYTLFVVNSTRKTPNKFAIFIVPEGRETEWMFATEEGREQLAMSAAFQRLIVVCLHPHHVYGGIDEVKAELSAKVMELAPPGVVSSRVPFLSLGGDINKRQVIHRGTSALSGDFIVEDVDFDGKMFRQLVFLSSRSIVQSQARLKKTESEKKKSKGGKKKLQVDLDYLGESHHTAMVGGLALVQDTNFENELKCVVIGLGGGSLVSFIHRMLPKMSIEAVELDEAIVNVAKDWFGLVTNENVTVHVDDGVKFINKMAQDGKKADVLIIDVDNKDKSIGISSPPKAFLEKELLDNICQVLNSSGVFVLNLCCRDRTLRKSVLDGVRGHFEQIFTKSIPEHVNEVVYCLPKGRPTLDVGAKGLPTLVKDSLQTLQKFAKPNSSSHIVNLTDSLRGLSLE